MNTTIEEQTIDATAAQLVEYFLFLNDTENRYQYLIELGKELPKGDDNLCRDVNKVEGCVATVWLESHIDNDSEDEPRLCFKGYSNAFIVRGLIAIALRLYSGRKAEEILSFDASSLFMRLSLDEHLTAQRSNGFHSMLQRIRVDALAAKNKI